MSKKPPQAPGSPAAPPTKRKGTSKGKTAPSAPAHAKRAPKPKSDPGLALTSAQSKQTEDAPNVLPFAKPKARLKAAKLDADTRSKAAAPEAPVDPSTQVDNLLAAQAKTTGKLYWQTLAATHKAADSLTLEAEERELRKRPNRPPTPYSRELTNRICDRLSRGELLLHICREDGMPWQETFLRWVLDDHDGLAQRYAQAREAWAHWHAEYTFELADRVRIGTQVKVNENGVEMVSRDMIDRTKLQIDVRKWLVSKLARKTYGDQLAVSGDVTMTLAARLKQLDEAEVPAHAALPRPLPENGT